MGGCTFILLSLTSKNFLEGAVLEESERNLKSELSYYTYNFTVYAKQIRTISFRATKRTRYLYFRIFFGTPIFLKK